MDIPILIHDFETFPMDDKAENLDSEHLDTVARDRPQELDVEYQASPVGLLICQDLMFMSKVSGTASCLGLRIEAAGSISQGLTKAAAGGYACVIVDLSLQPLAIRDLTANLHGTPPPPVIAFGAHVNLDRLEEARLAGCREVLPRSQFNARLPEILQKYLGSASD